MTKVEELFDKIVKCPCCRHEFITKKVRTSRLRVLERDSDFLNHYASREHPIKYNIFACSNCGYAASESNFFEITPKQISLIRDNISMLWVKREFGGRRNLSQGIETQKLALLQGNLLQYKNLELGSICLSLGWLYRIKGEKSEEKRFLTLAREKFLEAYNNESLAGSNMDESKLTYLIAELSRRIGDKDSALSWFNICLGLASTNMNPTLAETAREQWRLIREG